MNQPTLKDTPVPAQAAGGREALVKQLLLAAARGIGAGALRVALALVAAVLANAAGAAIAVAASDELSDGSRGAGILISVFILVPFMLAVGAIGTMAYRQALMGILARLLDTQAPALAALAATLLEKFLRKVNYQPGGPVAQALLGQWRRFLQLQQDLPRPMPMVLGSLAGKVPFSDSITAVATTGMSVQAVARAAMGRMVERAIAAGLRPDAGPLLGALALQFGLWVVLAAVLHYL
jgi:hypothetical protein